jgi:hypothetical protein
MSKRNVRIGMPPPIVVNLSCYGFFRFGQDFARAAAAVPEAQDRRSVVPYFLYCQAIELGLKAFLLLRGLSKRELAKRPFGHDLIRLLERARSEGIDRFVSISAAEEAAIQSATGFYDSGGAGKRLQYFDVGLALPAYRGLPDLAALASIARQLTENEKLEQEYLNA